MHKPFDLKKKDEGDILENVNHVTFQRFYLNNLTKNEEELLKKTKLLTENRILVLRCPRGQSHLRQACYSSLALRNKYIHLKRDYTQIGANKDGGFHQH